MWSRPSRSAAETTAGTRSKSGHLEHIVVAELRPGRGGSEEGRLRGCLVFGDLMDAVEQSLVTEGLEVEQQHTYSQHITMHRFPGSSWSRSYTPALKLCRTTSL